MFTSPKAQEGGKGVLVDLTKCIGCGSCVVACKMYNKNEWIEDRAPTSGEGAMLADENWTVVQQCRISKNSGKNLKVDGMSPPVRTNGSEEWRYVKRQCLHCKEPACASSCFATAFKKNETGATVYYPNLCVGCRYCMLACPFSIPKFEWDKPIPMLTKCSMCHNRIANGDAPACVSVCPTNVMKFGEQDELLKEAKEILANDSRYVKHIYGEDEAGGTAWIYISDKPFKELGFKTNVPKESIPKKTSLFSHAALPVGVVWAAILTCLYFLTKPRKAKKEKEKKEG
jgi:formate dehydrogenase iron-sulfur subunit